MEANKIVSPNKKYIPKGQGRVNDFNIHVATVNGTGSQSSNLVLLKPIFQMGIPVSGKNLLPSNIQGLPTWFTIRVSKDGYFARQDEIDILVAMNPGTADEDVKALQPGKVVIYNTPMKLNSRRDDVVFYPIPFDELVKEVCQVTKLKKLVRKQAHEP